MRSGFRSQVSVTRLPLGWEWRCGDVADAGLSVADGAGRGRKKRACWRTTDVRIRLLKVRLVCWASRRSLTESWMRMSSSSSVVCKTFSRLAIFVGCVFSRVGVLTFVVEQLLFKLKSSTAAWPESWLLCRKPTVLINVIQPMNSNKNEERIYLFACPERTRRWPKKIVTQFMERERPP